MSNANSKSRKDPVLKVNSRGCAELTAVQAQVQQLALLGSVTTDHYGPGQLETGPRPPRGA